MVPAVYVKSDSYMVRLQANTYGLRQTRPANLDAAKGHQQNVRELVLEPGEQDLPPSDDGDRFGNAVGSRRTAIVIDHGCTIDEQAEPRLVHVAVVRPLAGVHEGDRESIVTYDQKRTFYLPAGGPLDEDSYVDFRFITTVRRELLDTYDRFASLTEGGRTALKGQLTRYWIRKRLPEGWEEWEDEHDAGEEADDDAS